MTHFQKTLPASWFRSEVVLEKEKHAIFLKSWYLLGPVTRFHDVDKGITYEMVGRTFTVYRRSQEPTDLRIEAEDGSEMRSHLTPTGLLFVTLSTESETFDSYFPNLAPLLGRVNFTEFQHRRSLKYEGRYNWKTMVDGYLECLHCTSVHPEFSKDWVTGFYESQNHGNFSRQISDPRKPDDGLFLYFFPNCMLNVYNGGMNCCRVCPTSHPGVIRTEYDYYHQETGESFDKFYNASRKVAVEDFDVCQKAQRNLESGVYVEGLLNPKKETGVTHYQQRVRELLEQYDRDTGQGSATNDEVAVAADRKSGRGSDFAAFVQPTTV